MRIALFMAALLAAAPIPAWAQQLTLRGVDGQTVAVTPADLADLPQETVELDSHGTLVTYAGPLLFELLARAGAPESAAMHGRQLAKAVRITAADGYQVVLSLGETDPAMKASRVIVAPPLSEADRGEAAKGEAAGGYRIVVEGDLRAARSIYGVTRIDILDLGEDLPRTGSHH